MSLTLICQRVTDAAISLLTSPQVISACMVQPLGYSQITLAPIRQSHAMSASRFHLTWFGSPTLSHRSAVAANQTYSGIQLDDRLSFKGEAPKSRPELQGSPTSTWAVFQLYSNRFSFQPPLIIGLKHSISLGLGDCYVDYSD